MRNTTLAAQPGGTGGMRLEVFHRPWMMRCSYEEQFRIIAEEGYDAIEADVPPQEERESFRRLLGKYGFDYIAIVRSVGESWQDHTACLEKAIAAAAELGPVKVTCQGGRDYWDADTRCRFFEAMLELEQKLPFPICHETHRSRCTFTPWRTASLLERFPQLSLTADISHWYCVTESLLGDFAPEMERIIQNVRHVHCRVGYKEGPQVPHPGAPEYEKELLSHEYWWRKMIRACARSGQAVFTCTPEYNYSGNRYVHTLPFTDVPVVDGRKVCLWAKDRFREMFADEMAQTGAAAREIRSDWTRGRREQA